ncbi:MAG: ATP-binding protein [Desulfococcaceae bacterium]|jgi:signal transduction histidine kinase|nr:ATP-binding protein [Desulfococcaceae bacterium]
MIISALPIWFTDMAGAVLMILFSFLSLYHIRTLNRREPGNLIWTYLLWVSYFLAGFAVSRSAGHILKQILILSEHRELWDSIQAFSGTVNTFMLILVAATTLFFERVWQVYQGILNDRQALQSAHTELLLLNENLEKRVQDRTEALARSEKQIAQADKLASIGQFSSGIAHEINNPLGIILGYTQLLQRDEKPGSEKYEDLKTIEKHVKNCKSIVEDLLSFARSSRPVQNAVCIHECMDEVLTFIRHRSKSENIEIIKEYDRSIPKMILDEKKIKQVIINLMMNAIHAICGKGSIRIRTVYESRENRVLIRLKDTGYGIEKKNLTKIFDPFFTTKPTGEGTGLGLAVSYGIIKNHGGEILAESEMGKGTEFTIILPLTGKNAVMGECHE